MQSVSTLWNELFTSNANREVRFTINGIEYGSSRIVSARIERGCMDSLSIGNAVSASLNLSFFPVSDIPRMAEIVCEVRLKEPITDIYVGDEDGNVMMTEDGFIIAAQYAKQSEWITRGRFYVDTRKLDKSTGLLTVTAYDKMLFAEAPYIDQVGTYPMPMVNAVAFIADQIGVDVDERSEIYNGYVDSPTHVYNMREVLRFIAAASGGNFIISDTGKLRLVSVASPVNAVEYPCEELASIGDELTITGVRLLPDNDKEYFAGTTNGYVIEGECAYATQAMCNDVLAKLQGVAYRPVEVRGALLDPALEIGDSVAFGGIATTLSQDDVTLGSAMISNASAPVEDELEHEIPYQTRSREQRMTATSFSEIRKSTEAIALEVQGKLDEEDASSLIETSLEGITLSATAGSNQSTIKIMANGIEVDSAVVKFSSITATSVSASNITGSLTSDKIDLYGDLTVYSNSYLSGVGGYMGYTASTLDGSAGMHIESSNGASEVRVTSNGAAIENYRGGSVVCTNNCSISGEYIFFNAGDGCEMAPNRFNPVSDWGMDLGYSGNRWGTLYCGAVNDSSDRALKTNIEYGLDKYDAFFDKLKPCSYKFIREGENGKTNTGLIAQDIDAALSEVGFDRQDFAGLAMSDKVGASGLVYNQFISLLIDQTQKLKKRVDELEKIINQK